MGWLWGAGAFGVAYVAALLVQRRRRRDSISPFQFAAELPEPGPEAWTFTGAAYRGLEPRTPTARLVVTEGWIGIRVDSYYTGVMCYVVDRAEVATVVVASGFPVIGSSVGVRGHDSTPRLAVQGTNRRHAEAELDRLGWPHERARHRVLRPFA